jgi:hypothetical protein
MLILLTVILLWLPFYILAISKPVFQDFWDVYPSNKVWAIGEFVFW